MAQDAESVQIRNRLGFIDDTNPLQIQIGDGSNQAVVNNDGQLHTVLEGHLCDCNSTTVPLLADAIFTGDSKDILAYNGIAVFVTSDVGSAILGLKIQYSADGSTNWRTAEEYTVLSGAEKWFTPPAFGKYFRVIYTNGDIDQTFLEITTVMRKTPFKWSSHNIDMPITDQDDAELIKAVITGKRVDGDYDNVNLTNGNNMKVSLEELESGISSNSNSQLNITPFHTDGTEGILITGVKKEPNKDGIDSSTNSLQTVDYPHHEIHSGSHYFIEGWTTLPINGTLNVKLITPDTTKWSHFLWIIESSGILETHIVEAPTGGGTGGTSVTPVNNNRNSVNTSGVIITSGVTACTGGIIISSGAWGSKTSGGGGSTREDEIILKQDTIYCRNFTSRSASNIVHFKASWYEHTDKN